MQDKRSNTTTTLYGPARRPGRAEAVAQCAAPAETTRYVNTWLILGVLEQDPRSRRYRRSRPPEGRNA